MMKEISTVIEVFKQMPFKGWLLLLGVSIAPYFFTHMVLPSIGALFLVLFYTVEDVLSYKTALFIISIIAVLVGVFLYLWKPILLLSIGIVFTIIHYGIRSKLPILIALRNELMFLSLIIISFISLFIGIVMDKVQIVGSSSDGYVASIAICIGSVGYMSYSFYKTYIKYKTVKMKHSK